MPAGEITIREAAPEDAEFLRDMMFEVWLWDPDRSRDDHAVWAAAYDASGQANSREFGRRPGDAGFVAGVGEPIGAAWYRLFSASDAMRGFVDEGIPEVAGIAVRPSFRRRGIGRRLMDRLIARARADGHPALSLHVHAGNAPARGLYESLGFVEHRPDDIGLVMLLPFAQTSDSLTGG
jgi:ribosomal protein S18 acetylase RimI-like enzyme